LARHHRPYPDGQQRGGNLAIVVTQSLMLEPANVPVIMQVPIYPVCDNIRSHPSYEESARASC